MIEQIAEAYRRAGALEQLGRGVVATIPRMLDDAVPHAKADAWVDAWERAPFEGADIPVHMLQAARAWKRDRDQAHLLALPPEQREILVDMLPR